MTQGSPLAVPMPWDLVSSAYSEEVVPIFEEFAREALRIVAPPPGARVVDVACGPGTLSVLAARSSCIVDALDFSPQMIEQLRPRIGTLPITARIGDGQDLPFGDASFDAGFSMFGLMFFPDRAKGFAELRRVVRPGGKVLVSSWPSMDGFPVFAAMMGAIRETMYKAFGSPPAPERPGALSTVEECVAEMSASFADVEVRDFIVTQHAPSADALWDSMQRTMAPVVLMKKNLGDKFGAVDDAARAAIRKVIGDGEASVELTAHLTVGTAR
jgi:ubiquinone/menaquinone biosynthesis C-methylase UbiE